MRALVPVRSRLKSTVAFSWERNHSFIFSSVRRIFTHLSFLGIFTLSICCRTEPKPYILRQWNYVDSSLCEHRGSSLQSCAQMLFNIILKSPWQWMFSAISILTVDKIHILWTIRMSSRLYLPVERSCGYRRSLIKLPTTSSSIPQNYLWFINEVARHHMHLHSLFQLPIKIDTLHWGGRRRKRQCIKSSQIGRDDSFVPF